MRDLRQQPALAAALRQHTDVGSPRPSEVQREREARFDAIYYQSSRQAWEREQRGNAQPGNGPEVVGDTRYATQNTSDQEAQRQFIEESRRNITGQLQTLNLAPRDSNTWRPPWGWTPDPHPAPEASTRMPFLPAFAAHPSYLALRGPAPAPMDTPMFPEYYHMVDGRERVHDEATNENTRRTVE